jgi:hypothetical protein
MVTQSPLSPGYCHKEEEEEKKGLEEEEEGSSPFIHSWLRHWEQVLDQTV